MSYIDECSGLSGRSGLSSEDRQLHELASDLKTILGGTSPGRRKSLKFLLKEFIEKYNLDPYYRDRFDPEPTPFTLSMLSELRGICAVSDSDFAVRQLASWVEDKGRRQYFLSHYKSAMCWL
jgi:hypothetical protein